MLRSSDACWKLCRYISAWRDSIVLHTSLRTSQELLVPEHAVVLPEVCRTRACGLICLPTIAFDISRYAFQYCCLPAVVKCGEFDSYNVMKC